MPTVQTQDHSFAWRDGYGFTRRTLWPVRKRLLDFNIVHADEVGSRCDFEYGVRASCYLNAHILESHTPQCR